MKKLQRKAVIEKKKSRSRSSNKKSKIKGVSRNALNASVSSVNRKKYDQKEETLKSSVYSPLSTKNKMNSTMGSKKSTKSKRKTESMRKMSKRKSVSRSGSRYRVRTKKPVAPKPAHHKKPPILKQTINSSKASSRNLQSRNTFSRATFGAATKEKKSIVVKTPTLTIEDNEHSTLEQT